MNLSKTPWKDFRPKKLTADKYTNLSLYSFLLKYSIKTMLDNLTDLLKKVFQVGERIFFLPFVIPYKIYYGIMWKYIKNKG
jgi:hypothetical protein